LIYRVEKKRKILSNLVCIFDKTRNSLSSFISDLAGFDLLKLENQKLNQRFSDLEFENLNLKRFVEFKIKL
jgi:hypothetical protein